MKSALGSPLHPLQIVVGLVVWSLWFVAIYGGQAIACRICPPDPAQGVWNWLNGSLGLLTLLTLALLLGLTRYFWRLPLQRPSLNERELFVTKLAAGVHLVAALATAFVGAPLLQLPPCL